MDDIRRRDSSSQSLETTAEANQPKRRGMVLPFEPHSLTFDDVTYSVDMPQVTIIWKPRGIFQKLDHILIKYYILQT